MTEMQPHRAPEPENGIVLPRRPEIVLGHFDGSLFRTPGCHARVNENAVELSLTGVEHTFHEVMKLRRDPANVDRRAEEVVEALSSERGVTLSNVGVSLSLTVEIAGSDYAVVVQRNCDNQLKLISGYVDSAALLGVTPRGHLLGAALKELREELLVVENMGPPLEVEGAALIAKRSDPLACEIALTAEPAPCNSTSREVFALLGEPYRDSAAVQVAKGLWTITAAPLPAYLPSLHSSQTFTVSGDDVAGGFYYDSASNSGQVVFSFRAVIQPLDGVSLLHAESAPDLKRAGWIKEVLDPKGVVLMQLGPDGIPNGKSFQLIDGQLIDREVNASDLMLSEAFCPAIAVDGRSTGIVTRRSISYEEYRPYVMT